MVERPSHLLSNSIHLPAAGWMLRQCRSKCHACLSRVTTYIGFSPTLDYSAKSKGQENIAASERNFLE